MNEKRKQCPFCGGDVIHRWNTDETNEWLQCDTCGANGPEREDYELALAAWNRRADLAAAPVSVEVYDYLKYAIEADKGGLSNDDDEAHRICNAAQAWLDSQPAAPVSVDVLVRYVPEYEEFALGAVEDAIKQAFWAGVEAGREKMQEELADLAAASAPVPEDVQDSMAACVWCASVHGNREHAATMREWMQQSGIDLQAAYERLDAATDAALAEILAQRPAADEDGDE